MALPELQFPPKPLPPAARHEAHLEAHPEAHLYAKLQAKLRAGAQAGPSAADPAQDPVAGQRRSRLRLALLGLVMVLANAVLWGWLQGWARPWGLAPASTAEPGRLQQQIQPDRLTLISAEDLERAALAHARSTLPCWQIGPLDEAQHAALAQALARMSPAPFWQSHPIDEPERWLIFMGPYASPAVLERKRSELSALKLSASDVTHPQWGNGLSLGRFETAPLAQQALGALNLRGVRTARVVRDHGSRAGQLVSVWVPEAVWPAQREALLAALPKPSDHASWVWQVCAP